MAPHEQPSETKCIDNPVDFHDEYGLQYNCEWYGIGNNCEVYGDTFDASGVKAKDACCKCGGGAVIDHFPTLSIVPSSIPTSQPSLHPSISTYPTHGPTLSPIPTTSNIPSNAPVLFEDMLKDIAIGIVGTCALEKPVDCFPVETAALQWFYNGTNHPSMDQRHLKVC